jgi:hypothetical protein
MRIHRADNPPTPEERKKSNCRSYLHVYVKRGRIVKAGCAICGSTDKVEGHHNDYSKPLDVVWLCRGHHVMVTQGLIECPEYAVESSCGRVAQLADVDS